MAEATFKSTGVTFVLELDEAEARYVEAALHRSTPAELESDSPWDALYAAMAAAGVQVDHSAALPL